MPRAIVGHGPIIHSYYTIVSYECMIAGHGPTRPEPARHPHLTSRPARVLVALLRRRSVQLRRRGMGRRTTSCCSSWPAGTCRSTPSSSAPIHPRSRPGDADRRDAPRDRRPDGRRAPAHAAAAPSRTSPPAPPRGPGCARARRPPCWGTGSWRARAARCSAPRWVGTPSGSTSRTWSSATDLARGAPPKRCAGRAGQPRSPPLRCGYALLPPPLLHRRAEPALGETSRRPPG